jgi:flagellar assembly protein FliH
MTTTESTRILKANAARGLGSKIAFNFEDIRQRCDEYVEQIRQQTREMLEKAQSEADDIRHKALEEATTAGRLEGLQQADAEIQKRATELAEQITADRLKTSLPAVESAIEALAQERDRCLTQWEQTAVQPSVAIAERIVRRHIEATPQTDTQLFREALELAAGNAHIRIRLNPHDIEGLGESAEGFIASIGSFAQTELVPDESVARGGCVIETEHGVIDAQVETQLARITAELLQDSADSNITD